MWRSLHFAGYAVDSVRRKVATITTPNYIPRSGASFAAERDSLLRLLQNPTSMDRNTLNLINAVANQMSNSVNNLAQAQTAASSYLFPSANQNLNLMIAATSLNSVAAQAASTFAHVASTVPQVYPLMAQIATPNPSMDVYFQPQINRTTNICTCICNQMTCPVHLYESSLPTPPALRAAPIMVHRTPQVAQHQILPGRMPSAFSQVQVTQQSTVNQMNNQITRESLRLKRNQPTFPNDGRPAKVRRVVSIEENAPGSSQMDNNRLRMPNNGIEVAATSSTARFCQGCQQSFGPNVIRASLCPCHNQATCEDGCQQSFGPNVIRASLCPCHNQATCEDGIAYCRRCYDNLSAASSTPYFADVRRQQTERRRQAESAFYRPNTYELPLPTLPNPVMVVNNRPIMEFFFLNSAEPIFLNPQQTASQAHLIQQVLAHNHHIQEPAPVGATPDQIKKNTTILNYIKEPDVPENEQERCTVCLVDFETGDDVRTLNCSHMFHIDCIDRWLVYNKKCPVCRVDMDKPGTFTTQLQLLNKISYYLPEIGCLNGILLLMAPFILTNLRVIFLDRLLFIFPMHADFKAIDLATALQNPVNRFMQAYTLVFPMLQKFRYAWLFVKPFLFIALSKIACDKPFCFL
uniref:RING-type domain-containing protein n=1 Tax=Panagrolaimus sp. JU765 TaxID=591449 RepID=A0AC34QR67_9BILA